jgi:hypothetical protein
MKEYLILLLGMNQKTEEKEFFNVIVLADNSSEANEKADNFMKNFDSGLHWDVKQCTEITDITRI